MVATVLNFRPKRSKEDKHDQDIGGVSVPAGSTDWRVSQKVEDELTRKPVIGGQNTLERFVLSQKESRTVASYPVEDRNPDLLRNLAYGKRGRSVPLQTPESTPPGTIRHESSKTLEDVLKIFPKVPVLNN